MRVIDEIDIFADERLRQQMLALSWAILLAGLIIVMLCCVLAQDSIARIGLGLVISIIASIIASIVALPVHELIHTATFLLLGGRGHRVEFGFKDAFLYTRFHGPALTRARFVAVLLAPTVVLSVALPVLGRALGWPVAGLTAAFLHLSGCTGDLLMSRIILTTPNATHVEDTDTGCRLLG